ncbi:MAG TPA: MC/SLC25 family protein [Rhabdochlamydiaceae bacterium]|nr:MC/SLC25 family protein [Rhabdochlamydiaceae bacterium]
MTEKATPSPFYHFLVGAARNCGLSALLHPLEVIKLKKQSECSQKRNYLIATDIFRQEGIKGFYKGLWPQLAKTTLNALAWTIIPDSAHFLKDREIHPLHKAALKGVVISFFQAAALNPLEKTKVTSITQDRKFSFGPFLKEGWKGSGANFLNLSAKWSSFLVSRKYFSDKMRKEGELTPFQLVDIGVRTACIVSVVSAPTDVWKTWRLSDVKFSELFSKKFLRNMYRGWTLSATASLVSTIVTVAVLEELQKSSDS